ncbi:MAG TPA: hypothetical protein VE309_03870 [Caulobacteraceae bacterium]|nr:hypothetical protein [Caulobacteraceae bacterium]
MSGEFSGERPGGVCDALASTNGVDVAHDDAMTEIGEVIEAARRD